MQKLILDGIWNVTDASGELSLTGQVPGDVVSDLLNAGRIPDPYFRENEKDVQWIGERDWLYEREFEVSESLLNEDCVLLQCEGLDTFAEVEINGTKVAATDNMHRTYQWDVKPLLNAGGNKIRITFKSLNAYTRERNRERPMRAKVGCAHPDAYPAWVRKEACNFGWDWGPILVTAGIWRNISLLGFTMARLTDLRIEQDHTKANFVALSIASAVESFSGDTVTVNASLKLAGEIVEAASVAVENGVAQIDLKVEKPELWWPAGMGEQPLYELIIELIAADGTNLDSLHKRIGLRTLRLDRHKDKWGESFQFVANGVPFFAKGANWIPYDAVLGRRTPEMYRQLIEDSAAVNMNMLRVWGGGIYEDDCFYDICDELGICVWQDFMFACMDYPSWDEAFMKNVAAEARDNVRRLRHHACMALWCGNNELEQFGIGVERRQLQIMTWEEYGLLFDDLLADVVRELSPEIDYWPSSPHSPCGERSDHSNPQCGDAHLWDVWHGKKPFEWYRTCDHRFNSEFGFQSFPEPKTVYGYTEKQDRNVTTPVMEHHQRSGIGNTTIMQYMLDWFRLPTSFDMVLRTSQILQGMAIKYAVEHWRRSMPRGMGTLYWQLNDCWPVASWASIDYHGRWKALHHMARHFFAPVLVSGLEDPKTGTIEVHVTSDRLEPVPATLAWTVTDALGQPLQSGTEQVMTPVNGNAKVATLELAEKLAELGPRNIMVWLELKTADQAVSTNWVTFARPKQLELALDPEIQVEVTAHGEAFRATLSSKFPALWTWLELRDLDARCSDNYVHLRPGQDVVIDLCPAKQIGIDELRQQLVVQSLVDTFAAE